MRTITCWAPLVAVVALAGAEALGQPVACSCGYVHDGACHGFWTAPPASNGKSEGGDETFVPEEFRTIRRWNSTATNPSGLRFGEPTTITWGFLRDGTSISGAEGTSGSSLISMLNTLYGASPTSDLQDAPWFRFFDESFGRWAELSGVTYVYEPNDSGQPLNNLVTPLGELGVNADVRIGGHSIDGASGSNVLAYNYFPNHSDMVLDTDNSSFYGNRSADSLRLRNTLMHEAGHGLGLNHLESNNSAQLMEPFIDVTFFGPQFDDILGIQHFYGDALEKDGGNDTLATSAEAGTLDLFGAWAIGVDGDLTSPGQRIRADQTDFVSIDAFLDVDFFRFEAGSNGLVDFRLRPVGPTYSEGPQGGSQSTLVSSARSRLELTVLDSAGQIIATTPLGALGEESLLVDLPVSAGEQLYARVASVDPMIQLYRLDVALNAAPRLSTFVDLTTYQFAGAHTFASEVDGISFSISAIGGGGADLVNHPDGIGVASAIEGSISPSELLIHGDYVLPEEVNITFFDDVWLDNLEIAGLDLETIEQVVLSFVSGENPFAGIIGYDAPYEVTPESIALSSPEWQSDRVNFAFGVNGQSRLLVRAGTTLALSSANPIGGGIVFSSFSATLVPEPSAALLLLVALAAGANPRGVRAG